jgi:hypothetical protein
MDKNGTHKYSAIRLCGNDKKFASRFEEMGFKTSTNHSLKGDFYAYTGTYLKTAPDPHVDSPELIRAFVSGYLHADGTKASIGSGSIQSSELDHIEFIRDCFPVAGVYITSESELTGQVTNYGTRPYTISFSIHSNPGSKYNTGWNVKNIETDVLEDEVWCLEVDVDHSFILPNGIVTGNCSVSHCDRPAFFSESMYLMLCGVGVGFSVQTQHIAKLPKIARRSTKKAKIFQVPDSIEGWSDAYGVLLSSYFMDNGTHPEYRGSQVHFDFSKVRPKGSEISGGFKAPGPDGLRQSLIKCEALLEELLVNEPITNINSITAYDFVMHMSDAVLSGGVRRSATICVFSKTDMDMMTAKTGDWFPKNPQRGRSNNSVMLVRDQVTREEWANIIKSVKDFGEPGFIFSDNEEFLFNPCVTGDTLVTVKDHNLVSGGELIAEGTVYNMPMHVLVDLWNSSGGDNSICPLVLSLNTETGQKCWSRLMGAAKTRENAEVFEVTDVDTGKSVKATADHLLWTTNRGYVKVCELLESDTLKIE